MSGTYPTSPVFKGVNFKSKWYNVTSSSITGRTQSRSLGGQRFEFSAQYPKITQSQFGGVDAFIMAQQGSLETFTIVLPVISSASGSASGSPTVNGAHSIGDSTITVASLTGTLTAGDVVTFAGHTKVYKVTADLTGAGTLSISPPIIAAFSGGEAITYDSVPFTVRQKGDAQEFSVEPGVFYSYEVDFIEAV